MFKTIIVLILMIAVNTFVSSQSDPDNVDILSQEPSDWNSLSGDNYEIKYPSDWDVDTSGQMGMTFALFSPQLSESDNFKENVNLVVQNLTGYNMTLDQYVELSEGQVETMITDGDIILSARKTKTGVEYQQVIYTGRQGMFKLKFEQFYWVIEDKAYVLTLTCKEVEFENYKEVGAQILNSFELK